MQIKENDIPRIKTKPPNYRESDSCENCTFHIGHLNIGCKLYDLSNYFKDYKICDDHNKI